MFFQYTNILEFLFFFIIFFYFYFNFVYVHCLNAKKEFIIFSTLYYVVFNVNWFDAFHVCDSIIVWKLQFTVFFKIAFCFLSFLITAYNVQQKGKIKNCSLYFSKIIIINKQPFRPICVCISRGNDNIHSIEWIYIDNMI